MRQILVALLLLLLAHAAAAERAADYHYDGTLTINAQTGHIAADWRISVADGTQESITFVLRDTLDDIDVSGDSVVDVDIATAEGLAAFRTATIRLAPGDDRRVIRVRYFGILLPEPMDNRINSIEPDRVELNVDSFWMPIDNRFDRDLTADLTVRIGAGWQGVTTGVVEPARDGVRLINMEPQVDIAFTLARAWRTTEVDGFTVYDLREESVGTDRLIEAARYCVRYLNERFGQGEPLPRGKLLITGRPSSGYARANYVVFTDIADTEPGPLTRFVCHEFSHHWNRGAAFDTVENWLNEAFAEYIGLMVVRERFGEQAYAAMLQTFREQIADQSLPPVWRPGDTARGPYLVQYRKGPLLLARLEEEMGRDAFQRVLQAWLAQPVRTTPRLLDVLERGSSAAQRGRFENWLGDRDEPAAGAQVMLMGTFHFKDSGLDAVKVEDFDVMAPAAQAYLDGLGRRLAAFKPTRVLLEYNPQNEELINDEYQAYLAGDFSLPANEIYQIGFRVAKIAGLEQVSSFDERTIAWAADALFDYAKANDAPEMARLEAVLASMTDESKARRRTMGLRQLLMVQNDPGTERRNMDLYLLTNVVGARDGYVGADAAASWWQRNFRMFANIQQHAQPGERVLAIGGTGHMAILKQLLAIDTRLEAVDVRPFLDHE